MPYLLTACQYGWNAARAFGGILYQIADLSVRGVKRTFQSAAPVEAPATITRVITDVETQTRAIEERSESADGSVKRRRVDELARRPSPNHPPIRIPNPHWRATNRPQRNFASTDYTAGINWNFTPEVAARNTDAEALAKALEDVKAAAKAQKEEEEAKARLDAELLKLRIEAELERQRLEDEARTAALTTHIYEIRLPGSEISTKYDLLDRPVQWSRPGPIRRAQQPRSSLHHPYKISDAKKQQAKAEKIAKQEVEIEKLDYAARQKKYAADAAIRREENRKMQKAIEEAEERERLEKEEEARKQSWREARWRQQEQAASRRALKEEEDRRIWAEREAIVYEKDPEEVRVESAAMAKEKDLQKSAVQGRGGNLTLFEQFMQRHPGAPYRTDQAYQQASSFFEVSAMSTNSNAFAPESPEVSARSTNSNAFAPESLEVPARSTNSNAFAPESPEVPARSTNSNAFAPESPEVPAVVSTPGAPESPDVPVMDGHAATLIHRGEVLTPQTFQNTQANKKSTMQASDLLTPVAKVKKDVRYVISPYTGLEHGECKIFDKSEPSNVLHTPEQPWHTIKKSYFFVRPLDAVLRIGNDHPRCVAPNVAYGVGPQYDDPVVAEPGDVAMPDVSPPPLPSIGTSNGTTTHRPILSHRSSQQAQPSPLPVTNGNVTIVSSRPEDNLTNGVSHSDAAPLHSNTPFHGQPPSTSTEGSRPVPIDRSSGNGSRKLDVEQENLLLYKMDYHLSGLSLKRVESIREAKKKEAAEKEARRKAKEAAAKAKAEAEAAEARAQAEKEAKEKAEAEAKLAEEERQARSQRCMPDYKFVGPISEDWERRLAEIMRKRDSAEIVKLPTGTVLKAHDFKTVLKETSWLNDEIINAHLEQTVREANEKAQEAKYVCQNSYFYKNLSELGPDSVKRWMRRKKAGGADLLKFDGVFIPVNPGNHWTLFVVSPKMKTIEYFDSLSYPGSDAKVRLIRRWLANELGPLYVESEWTLLDTPCSQQNNGHDCGAFTVTNAKVVSMGYDPTCFAAADMQTQRKQIAVDIIKGGQLLV